MSDRSTSGCVRILTPPGRGAVAVTELRCASHDAAVCLLRRHFASIRGTELTLVRPGRVLYGRWREEDVVLVRTGPATWEIHSHGGVAAVQSIVRDLLEAQEIGVGTEPTDSAEETDSADAVVTLESEVRRLLLLARTRKTAVHLLSQSDGRLVRAISQVTAAAEQLTPTDRPAVALQLDELLKWSNFASHLIAPWRVLILGRPNAGKSSLVNRIVGLNRSIVFDQPGTTRDVVEAEAVLDGWPFLFCDSAGLRDPAAGGNSAADGDTAEADDKAACEIEQVGMQTAISRIEDCDMVLLVHDATDDAQQDWIPFELRDCARPVIVVRNKIDLPSRMLTSNGQSANCHSEVERDSGKLPAPGSWMVHSVSALTGLGISELMAAIVQNVIPQEPSTDAALPLPGVIAGHLLALSESELGSPESLAAIRQLRALSSPG